MVALERADIKVEKYYSYEIDPSAITVSNNNYPLIEQRGNVLGADFTQYKGIDLLIGGSPCQGFSASGKQLNFSDPRSRLFFEFARALKESRPRYFMLENVVMRKEWQDVISTHLECDPVVIDSALVSAQIRNRLYWTNIPGVAPPKDRKIALYNILERRYWNNPAAIRGRRLGDDGRRAERDASAPISQCLEVRSHNTDKSNCLTTVEKDNVLTSLPPGRYPDAFKNNLPFRYYSTVEYCRLQTLPDCYVDGTPETTAKKLLGNCWTVDVVAHIFRNMH